MLNIGTNINDILTIFVRPVAVVCDVAVAVDAAAVVAAEQPVLVGLTSAAPARG
jgi:hypothetical protein